MTDHESDYVEGDINQVDDAFDDLDDEHDEGEGNRDDANRDEGVISKAVLTHIATSLADEPDAVSVETDARGRRITLRLSVAQPDMGRIIGRRGRTAQAIRALVAAAGAREGLTTSVDIVD